MSSPQWCDSEALDVLKLERLCQKVRGLQRLRRRANGWIEVWSQEPDEGPDNWAWKCALRNLVTVLGVLLWSGFRHSLEGLFLGPRTCWRRSHGADGCSGTREAADTPLQCAREHRGVSCCLVKRLCRCDLDAAGKRIE